MSGKCPKCELEIAAVTAVFTEIKAAGQNSLKGVSYLCPHCQTVLSVEIDPVAMRSATVNRIVKGLKVNA
jgi:hypothetical protein